MATATVKYKGDDREGIHLQSAIYEGIGNKSSSTDASPESLLRQMSNENTARTFEFNANEAQKARDFSEYMSNTSHQREVEDLKRAGLNPVLSANGGAASYSAASASGTADNSAVGVLASLYQTKLNNDNAVKIAKMNNENNKEIAKINAQASKYASDKSSSASKYASDNSLYGTQYGVDRSKYGIVDNFVSSLTYLTSRRSRFSIITK